MLPAVEAGHAFDTGGRMSNTINNVAGYTSAASTKSTKSSGTQDSATPQVGDQFMSMLLAQLRNQHPLEPMEDSALMTQMTQLNSLSELQNINSGLQSMNTGLVKMNQSNQLTEAAALIGKTAQVSLDDGQTRSGIVTGVSTSKGEIMLWLGDLEVALSKLITVKDTIPSNGGTTNG